MRHRILPRLLVSLLLVLWLPGCGDFVVVGPDDEAAPTAEKPEGWESLDDEGSAMRLYYQFVDERRQVRFVETLEDVPPALRATVGFVKMDVPPPLSPGDAARARDARRKQGGPRIGATASSGQGAGIVLYSAEWCGACKKARRWLSRNGVDYELRDIDDPRWAEELMQKTGRRAVPVIDVRGRILTGFSVSGYEQLVRRG